MFSDFHSDTSGVQSGIGDTAPQSYSSFDDGYPFVTNKSFQGRYTTASYYNEVRDFTGIMNDLVQVQTNSAALTRQNCDVYTDAQYGCVTVYGFNGHEKLFGHLTPNLSLGFKFKDWKPEQQQQYVDFAVNRVLEPLITKYGNLRDLKIVVLVNLASENGGAYDAKIEERDWRRLKESFARYGAQAGIVELPITNSSVLSSKENPHEILVVGQKATIDPESGSVLFDKDPRKAVHRFRIDLEKASQGEFFQKRSRPQEAKADVEPDRESLLPVSLQRRLEL